MKHFINLIEYLESNHHYAQVDEMVKTALDMSDVFNENNLKGQGAYGEFYSDFSTKDKQIIKGRLGNVSDNIGFKSYHSRFRNADHIANIKENLAFIYIAPYIKENTDLNTPLYNGSMSLSGMIINHLVPTQKMSGVFMEEALNEMNNQIIYFGDHQYYKIPYITEDAIDKKLESIGVKWFDIHDQNYLLNPNTIKEYIENNKKTDQYNYDISKGASLFDFGGFNISASTEPGNKLLILKERLLNKRNQINQSIIKAINDIII
mgnify:CR=1 FL=1